jgi:outer membrane protein TolC
LAQPQPASQSETEAGTALRPVSQAEAVRAALAKSPTLGSAELDVRSAKQQVLAEQGRYPYYLGADAGVTRSSSTQLRANDTVSSSSSRTIDAGVGVRRLFPFGTQAELRADGQYFNLDSPSSVTGATPFAASGYGATVRASVVQPLLRGYGRRVGEANLRAARAAQKVSERSLERTRSALVGDVLSAYFELWYASQVIDIESASLELAHEQLEQARQRLMMGAISQVDLLAFRTRAAELDEAVVSAELSRQQRSVTLSQLMGGTVVTDLYAASAPGLPARAFNQQSVAKAMADDSVELADLKQQVELARTRAEVAGESWRPQLDLEAWAQSGGASTEFPGAWARAAQGSYWSAHGGLVFDVPLDSSAKHAEQMQAQLAVQSAEQQLRAARTRIGSDAASAIASQGAAAAKLNSATRTTSIAEQTYFAERERYQLGQTIAIQVQQAEDTLRRARLREARARVDAAQANLVLLHLTGELLRSN